MPDTYQGFTIMKKLFYCILCASVFMLTTACGDDVDNVLEDTPENNEDKPGTSAVSKPHVSLSYVFTCDSDLVSFVTPEVIYTDSLGTHNVVLDENMLTPTTYAICYSTEDGTTSYEFFEVGKDGKVPEPWIVERYSTFFSWQQNVGLNEVDVVNDCIVKFHRKYNYVIDAEKQYELVRRLSCPRGVANVVVDGIIYLETYNNIIIGSNEKTSWYGYEVEDFIDELCAKDIVVSMKIDSKGKISQLSK